MVVENNFTSIYGDGVAWISEKTQINYTSSLLLEILMSTKRQKNLHLKILHILKNGNCTKKFEYPYLMS